MSWIEDYIDAVLGEHGAMTRALVVAVSEGSDSVVGMCGCVCGCLKRKDSNMLV